MRLSIASVLAVAVACSQPAPPSPPPARPPPGPRSAPPPPKYVITRPVLDLAISADGARLGALSVDTVGWFDVATGAKVWSAPAAATALAAAPDGSWLAVGGADLVLMGPPDGTEHARVPGLGVRDLAASPDGKRLWVASSAGVRAYDPVSGAPGVVLSDQPTGAVAANGSRVVSGGDDGVVRVWDAVTGNATVALTGHPSPVLTVAISDDGLWAASRAEEADGPLRLWDVAGGKLATSFGVLPGAALCPLGGPEFAVGAGEVLVYDVARASLLYSFGEDAWGGAGVIAVACAPGWVGVAGAPGILRYVAATGEPLP